MVCQAGSESSSDSGIGGVPLGMIVMSVKVANTRREVTVRFGSHCCRGSRKEFNCRRIVGTSSYGQPGSRKFTDNTPSRMRACASVWRPAPTTFLSDDEEKHPSPDCPQVWAPHWRRHHHDQRLPRVTLE